MRRASMYWAVVAVAAIATVAILWLASVAGVGLGGLLNPFHPPSPSPPGGPGNNSSSTPYTLVSYTSSVDGTGLSYYEWLPTGYDANRTYPLAIYLHGQFLDGDELIQHDGGPQVTAAAQAAGYILISINTPRTDSGFYVNSRYTGPEEQDVLDAIAHEKGIRSIGSLYIFGSSMGTVGAYSLVGHHPGEFAGIGALNSCPDMFEAIQWRILTHNDASLSAVEQVLGALPNKSAYAFGLAYYLSSARYFPQNYSGLQIYVTQGGEDVDCPNNVSVWPYQAANNTVLNSTCTTVPALLEPADCTVPFANFSSTDPAEWHWRFVYEPLGKHNLNEVNATDLFAFWSGDLPSGLYWGGYPGGTDLEARSW